MSKRGVSVLVNYRCIAYYDIRGTHLLLLLLCSIQFVLFPLPISTPFIVLATRYDTRTQNFTITMRIFAAAAVFAAALLARVTADDVDHIFDEFNNTWITAADKWTHGYIADA
jgi:hypothetical protein